jgi:hypothetical protein
MALLDLKSNMLFDLYQAILPRGLWATRRIICGDL